MLLTRGIDYDNMEYVPDEEIEKSFFRFHGQVELCGDIVDAAAVLYEYNEERYQELLELFAQEELGLTKDPNSGDWYDIEWIAEPDLDLDYCYAQKEFF